MRVTAWKNLGRDGKMHADVNIEGMTLEESETLFKTLNAVEAPKPFIKALVVNLKRKLFNRKETK